MDLITACKSGKKFRRPQWGVWGRVRLDDVLSYGVHDSILPLSTQDIEATDYILAEKTVTITETEFDNALKRAQESVENALSYRSMTEEFKRELFK